jgi:hypothetical protein
MILLCLSVGVGGCSDDDEGGDGDGGGGSGGSGSGTTQVNCQVENMGEVIGCNEYTIPNAAVDASRDACTTGGGTLVDECPTANSIGRCTVMGIVSYYYGNIDAADAEQLCASLSGTWTAA